MRIFYNLLLFTTNHLFDQLYCCFLVIIPHLRPCDLLSSCNLHSCTLANNIQVSFVATTEFYRIFVLFIDIFCLVLGLQSFCLIIHFVLVWSCLVFALYIIIRHCLWTSFHSLVPINYFHSSILMNVYRGNS